MVISFQNKRNGMRSCNQHCWNHTENKRTEDRSHSDWKEKNRTNWHLIDIWIDRPAAHSPTTINLNWHNICLRCNWTVVTGQVEMTTAISCQVGLKMNFKINECWIEISHLFPGPLRPDVSRLLPRSHSTNVASNLQEHHWNRCVWPRTTCQRKKRYRENCFFYVFQFFGTRIKSWKNDKFTARFFRFCKKIPCMQ